MTRFAPPLVLDLRDPAASDPGAVGAKAARLAELLDRGLPVPPGIVITTHALRGAIAGSALEAFCRRAAEELRSGDRARAVAAGAAAARALRELPIPPAVQRLFVDAYTDLLRRPMRPDAADRHAPLFAVRSSASDEDGTERSHAGQYESHLNLRGLEPIYEAVRDVWASWYSERAVGYRLTDQGDAVLPPMAVLVQRMVHPRASGMLFTVNPVSGSLREMTLEAASGLGEALAQGRVHPDYFVISRGDRLRIAERGIARKERRLETTAPGSGRVVFREVPPDEQRKPALSDAEALAIGELGLAAEDLLGGPADIEWTIDRDGLLFLVQARPVTAVPSGSGAAASEAFRDRPVLWTQRFCGERWPDQATPLGWSLIQPVLHHFTEWKGASAGWLNDTPPTRLYRGRPYFNITIFRHLVFRLPGRNPPEVILEMFPAEEQRAMRNAAPYLPDWRLVRAIFAEGAAEKRAERYRYNVLTNHQEWEEFRPRLDAETTALPLDFDTAAAGLEAVEQGRALIVQYLQIHLLSLLFAHLCYQLLDVALRSWVGESGEALRSALVADAGDNRTLQVNQALWDLAEAARRAPEVRRWLEAGLPGGVDALGDLGSPEFERSLRRFLVDYGHRSSASWEVFSTRWADDPELVLRLVAGTLNAGATADPAVHADRRGRDRMQAERLVRRRMTRTLARRVMPWRTLLFGELLDLTRRYMALRENQRFSYDRLLFRMKRIFERVGALLERDGRLESGEAIVFLEMDELTDLVAGRLAPERATQIAVERRAQFDADRVKPHPDFLEGGNRHLDPVDHAGALEGLGISPGVARGTVRVLTSPAQVARLQPGDILVARSTDPGWTPLFLTAGGLVLELGSYLSHGAVVAREYRLPAVVNVEGACRILEDGMDVTVDGDRGRILVHGQKSARDDWPGKCEDPRPQ